MTKVILIAATSQAPARPSTAPAASSSVPAPISTKRPAEEDLMATKRGRVPRFPGAGRRLPTEPVPPPMKIHEKIPAFTGRAQRLDGGGVQAAARKRMLEIADRAMQATTGRQNFDKRVEDDRRRRRGGAPGDVVALGKRKGVDPDTRSILRKPPGAQGNARQRIYGPRTQIYDIAG